MTMRGLFRVIVLAIFAITFSACNMPGVGEAAPEEPEPTLTPTLGAAAPVAPEEAEEVAETEEAGETGGDAGAPCYEVEVVDDVTIPDGTEIAAGTGFDKTWRLRSSGCEPLPVGSQLVFDSGDAMGGPASVAVPSVAVGAEFDLTVHLIAPSTPGEYTGYWQIVGPTGDYIGQVYVRIVSVAPSSSGPTPVSGASEPEEPEEEEPTRQTIYLQPVARVSGSWISPGSGCGSEIQAGIAPNGNRYQGVSSFDVRALEDARATIINATLDLSSFTASNHAFADLGPLIIENVLYATMYDCSNDVDDPFIMVELARANHPSDLQAPIDITDAMAAAIHPVETYCSYFQIRLHWERDDVGLPNMIEWPTIALMVEYEQ
jgi:hypothetical protein